MNWWLLATCLLSALCMAFGLFVVWTYRDRR